MTKPPGWTSRARPNAERKRALYGVHRAHGRCPRCRRPHRALRFVCCLRCRGEMSRTTRRIRAALREGQV